MSQNQRIFLVGRELRRFLVQPPVQAGSSAGSGHVSQGHIQLALKKPSRMETAQSLWASYPTAWLYLCWKSLSSCRVWSSLFPVYECCLVLLPLGDFKSMAPSSWCSFLVGSVGGLLLGRPEAISPPDSTSSGPSASPCRVNDPAPIICLSCSGGYQTGCNNTLDVV